MPASWARAPGEMARKTSEGVMEMRIIVNDDVQRSLLVAHVVLSVVDVVGGVEELAEAIVGRMTP